MGTVPFYIAIAALCVFIAVAIGTYSWISRLHHLHQGPRRSDSLLQARMINEIRFNINYNPNQHKWRIWLISFKIYVFWALWILHAFLSLSEFYSACYFNLAIIYTLSSSKLNLYPRKNVLISLCSSRNCLHSRTIFLHYCSKGALSIF